MPNGDREYRTVGEQVRDMENERHRLDEKIRQLERDNKKLRDQIEALKTSIRLLDQRER